jgi:hypothetical protein
MPNRRRTWPYDGQADSPPAITVGASGVLNSSRSLVGPLRRGTAPGVGPRGRADGGGGSDLGTDRVSPIGFDPMGTSLEREPRQEPSRLISGEVRRRDE